MATKTDPDKDYRPDSVKKYDDFDDIVGQIPESERAQMESDAADGAADDIIASGRGKKSSDDSGKDSLYSSDGQENRGLRDIAKDEVKSLPKKAVGRLTGLSTKKKAIYTGAGGTLIGLIAFIVPILTGPLQFLNIADILTRNFAPFELVTENRSDNLLRRLRYGPNNPERGRLGIIGNRVADNIEARMNADGIEIVKSAGGYMEGIRYKGELIETTRSNASRRSQLRATLRAEGYSRTAAAIMSRPISYRYGVEYKHLGNVKRALFDSWAEFRQARIDDGENRIKNGSSDAPNLSAEDRQQQIDELEAQRQELLDAGVPPDDQRLIDIEAQLAELRGSFNVPDGELEAVGDTYENTDGTRTEKKAAAKAELSGRLTNGPFLVTVLSISVCFTQNVAGQAVALERANIYLPEWRLAAEAMSIGSQIQAGEDVDVEELAVLSERFVNEQEGDSWDAAKTALYQNTGETNGIPATDNLIPGTTQESNFVKFSESLSNFAGFDLESLCSIIESVAFQIGSYVIEFFLGGFGLASLAADLVLDEVVSLFLGPAGDAIATRLAGEEVAHMMYGAEYGNAVAIGGHIASNEVARSVGGLSLNSAEAVALNELVEEREREQLSEKSFFARMVDPANPRSLVGNTLIDSHSGYGEMIAGLARNPLGLLTGSADQLIGSMEDRALAQSSDLPRVYEFIPQINFSVQDIDDPDLQDPFENQNYLIDRYGSDQAIDEFFVPCMDYLEPLNDPDIKVDYFKAVPGTSDDAADCQLDFSNPEDEKLLRRYRIYQLDINSMLTLGCYGGDVASCNELDLAFHFEGNEDSDEVAKAIWSDQATETLIAKTRAHNQLCESEPNHPDCTGGSNFAQIFFNHLLEPFTKITRPEQLF